MMQIRVHSCIPIPNPEMDFTGAMRTVENSIGMSEAVKPFTHCDVGLKPNLVNQVTLSGMPAYVVRPL